MSPRTAPAPVVPQPRTEEVVEPPAGRAPAARPVRRDPVDAMLNWWLLAFFLLAVFAIVMVSLGVRSA